MKRRWPWLAGAVLLASILGTALVIFRAQQTPPMPPQLAPVASAPANTPPRASPTKRILANARAALVARIVNQTFDDANDAAPIDGPAAPSVHAEADEPAHSISVWIDGGSAEARQNLSVALWDLVARMDATPGIASATTFAETCVDQVPVTKAPVKQAAMIIDALSTGHPVPWSGVHAQADPGNTMILLHGTTPEQVSAAKAFIVEADANNQWPTLENQAFDGVFFIVTLKTRKPADVAARLNAEYAGHATFVAYTDTSLVVTCNKRNESQIRAELTALDQEGAAAPNPPAFAPGDADAVLFYRPNDVRVLNGLTTPTSVTVMAAHLTQQGIQTTELFTHFLPSDSLTASLGPLVCAAAGKFYFSPGEWLQCYDVHTDRLTMLGQANGLFFLHGMIYYAEERNGYHLAVCDPASQTGGYLLTWSGEPRASAIVRMLPSPDGKRIAWVARSNGAGSGSIGIFDLAARTTTTLVSKIPYTPPPGRAGNPPGANLIAWRNDSSLLTVTTVQSANPATAPSQNVLTAIDVISGALTRLCPISPTATWLTLSPSTPNTDLTLSAQGNPGGLWTFCDTPPALVEGLTRWGSFQCDAQFNLWLQGRKLPIDPFYLRNGARLSPDGKRLLYLYSGVRDRDELHVVDAATGTDQIVAPTAPDLSFSWFNFRDLAAPATPPQAPANFIPLDQLAQSASAYTPIPSRHVGN